MRTVSAADLDVRREVYLAAALDSISIGRLAGLPHLTGTRCLDLGPAGSAVPVWLRDRVGAGGEVVTASGDPLPPAVLAPGRYGLIRARLLLMCVRHPEALLRRLVAALGPGGTLVVEDWHLWPDDAVLCAPSPRDATLVERCLRLLAKEILPGLGVDPTWATRAHAAARAAGLTTVDTEIHVPVWAAGDPGALLLAVDTVRHRGRLLAAGLGPAELDRVRQLAADPGSGLVLRGHPLYSTSGPAPPW
ncbi:class I SAM-dependent methyltransferase [Phytohabitans sp. ZYX-F-186]|uniref:Class I SAM-dependent methyltransferase n=1 Tax=Phytohabitans maris TaxID=3071409 RepID=A0ABU0ZI16_9ACTN|nr:class I SAM-dependent methyltransferase [Phytohabitans sp. ZYX-F-186]MDQ7906017.1 class I SAM-dependent methyltransferase [Phytohabitans sp. ZYX-F-186]